MEIDLSQSWEYIKTLSPLMSILVIMIGAITYILARYLPVYLDKSNCEKELIAIREEMNNNKLKCDEKLDKITEEMKTEKESSQKFRDDYFKIVGQIETIKEYYKKQGYDNITGLEA